jgi:hypothetical protein
MLILISIGHSVAENHFYPATVIQRLHCLIFHLSFDTPDLRFISPRQTGHPMVAAARQVNRIGPPEN